MTQLKMNECCSCGKTWLAGTNPPHSCIRELQGMVNDLVKVVDMLMPGVPHIVADVGLLNDVLCKARPVARKA